MARKETQKKNANKHASNTRRRERKHSNNVRNMARKAAGRSTHTTAVCGSSFCDHYTGCDPWKG